MKTNSKYLFSSIVNNIYQRDRYPHLASLIPIQRCFRDLDLLSKSITYSLITPYYDRVDYSWPLIRRALCNGDNKQIYISLIFNKPTCLGDLRVTYINNLQEVNLFPSLKEKVLSNLLDITRC